MRGEGARRETTVDLQVPIHTERSDVVGTRIGNLPLSQINKETAAAKEQH